MSSELRVQCAQLTRHSLGEVESCGFISIALQVFEKAGETSNGGTHNASSFLQCSYVAHSRQAARAENKGEGKHVAVRVAPIRTKREFLRKNYPRVTSSTCIRLEGPIMLSDGDRLMVVCAKCHSISFGMCTCVCGQGVMYKCWCLQYAPTVVFCFLTYTQLYMHSLYNTYALMYIHLLE